jgi:alcohol dehydrogenase class IV
MNPFNAFQVARLPEIRFGSGTFDTLPDLISPLRGPGPAGHRPPIAARVATLAACWSMDCVTAGIQWVHTVVDGEPSPQLVDTPCPPTTERAIDAWSVSAAAACSTPPRRSPGCCSPATASWITSKALAAACRTRAGATPFIAVPTTAGTGSEATKNAVLSQRGIDGYKKSFRDAQLVAEVAVVDPSLLASCPKALIAANGMDAFTQLLESYVSLRASPFTDALASSGMQAFRDGFWPAWTPGDPLAQQGYQKIAYASLCSGITLAQAGLGSVHGLASPLGAFFPIPHGVVCGTLVAAATRINIATLRERDPNSPALRKYAEAGLLLGTQMYASEAAAQDGLVELLEDWTERLSLPRLGELRHERRGHPPRGRQLPRRQHADQPAGVERRRPRRIAAQSALTGWLETDTDTDPTTDPGAAAAAADTNANTRRNPGSAACTTHRTLPELQRVGDDDWITVRRVTDLSVGEPLQAATHLEETAC